jgi:alkanesulfonate monooxygenase SsuD/methylene tetrahydromethanopterin reductase-like flavin-dependent oxidoreductase (luciferase family)
VTALVSDAGFILAGNYPESDPAAGLESVLRLIVLGEELGYQVAGIRQRHLERGVSSALPFLAAASQRTDEIRLETDVVPLGYETPFRLAEDFATVDALSGGRVNVGISTSAPHNELLQELARPDAAAGADAYALVARFLDALSGRDLAAEPVATPYGRQIPRIQPHVPGLRDRVWLGGGSERSIRWAANHGLGLLLGNITTGDAVGSNGSGSVGSGSFGSVSFEAAQRAQIDDYDAHFAGRAASVGVERVIVPFDGATRTQRDHYRAYAAGREERTRQPAVHGGRSIIFQRDLVGPSDEIIERLRADPVFDGRTRLRVSLPYGFADDEYVQILTAIRAHVLPGLGWTPRESAASAAA